LSTLKGIIGDFKPEPVPTPTTLDISAVKDDSQGGPESSAGGYHTTALGGTFDHLHAAHKLLLHLSLFLTTNKLIVGLMTPSLLVSKSNHQLLEPLDERIRKVHDYLKRIDIDGVELDVCEIHDPYGPTAWDGDIQALVVSRETMSGGEAVNKKRREGGLGELDIWVIDVIAAEPELATPAGGAEGVSLGDENRGNHSSIKTRDLTLETDEGKLKALKMGSTAIRQWIKDHPGET
jgi:pantetheine-phosphate adenylyltransferase